MPLETVTHLSDLNQSNPPGTDTKAQGDDHIRNIKLALRTDLPNINAVVNCTPAQLNLLNSIAALTVLANATNGAAGPTALAAASDGQVLRRASSLLAFGAVDTQNPLAVTNPQIITRCNSQIFNLTSYVDINLLLNMPLEANTWYSFECFLQVLNTSTGGWKMKGVFSNAPQLERTWISKSTTLVDVSQYNVNDTIQGAGGLLVFPATAADTDCFYMRGAFLSNAVTGGTFKMQGAQNAVLGVCTLQAGGHVILTKMA
jgi:hypothetical protein